MTIDWTNFTPVSATLGGLMIGLAATIMVLTLGRSMGVSSLLGALLSPVGRSDGWRWGFLGGLVLAPIALVLAAGLPMPKLDASWPVLVAGGLLVGYGTRLGSGCTSGHGICGMARLSARSLVATLAFMASGFATVFLIRHVI